MAEIAKPAAVRERAETSERRRPDPAHEYTHLPGHNTASSERKKVPLTDAIGALCTHPDWSGVLQFDEFRRRPLAVNPPLRMALESTGLTNADVAGVRTWFEANGVAISKDECATAIEAACKRNAFHPIKEWLAGLPAADSSILDTLATRALGATEPMAGEFLRKFLVGAVRRILRPGCQMDTALVLLGKQGALKSSFVRVLFGAEWSRSQMPDLATKDASGALAGFWGIELGELDSVLRAEDSTVKEFLTRTFDDYRPPYERADQRFPRECVFIGTTNKEDFLRDPTGGRRFWPIAVNGKIDLDYVTAHRDQIWAAALGLARTDFRHWVEDEATAEDAREGYASLDPWHDEIEKFCAGREWIAGIEIFTECISRGENGAKLLKFDRSASRRIADTLRRLGCANERRYVGGIRERAWRVPEALARAEVRTRVAVSPAVSLAQRAAELARGEPPPSRTNAH
jgi:hypothetical protein